MRSWMILLVVVLSACAAVPVGAVPRYTVTDLTVQAGLVSAADINNAGQIVGSIWTGAYDQDGILETHAVLWEDGRTTDLHAWDSGRELCLGD